MSQGNLIMPTVGPLSPASLTGTNIQAAFDAVVSKNSGATAPTNHSGGALQFQDWFDTSGPPTVPWWIWDGGAWILIGKFDVSANHLWKPFLGAGSPIGTTTIIANTNDWAPAGFSTANRFPITAASPFNITGMAGGTDGRMAILECQAGSSTFTLTAEDTNSIAANRFNLGSSKTLAAFQTATFYYSSALSRWRLQSLI